MMSSQFFYAFMAFFAIIKAIEMMVKAHGCCRLFVLHFFGVLTVFVSLRKEVTCKNKIFGPSQTKQFLV